MTLQQLREVSVFIDRLAKCGYFDGFAKDDRVDLTKLLHDIGIHESSDDVISSLSIRDELRPGYQYAIVVNIGMVRALTICDELCAPLIIHNIMSINILSDRMMDEQIINTHYITFADQIYAYNKGYRIIFGNGIQSGNRITEINNASHNGLYIRSLQPSNTEIDTVQLSPFLLNEIVHINTRYITINSISRILPQCKNIEILDEISQYDLGKLPFVQNIRNITSKYISNDDIKLCTHIYKLDIGNNTRVSSCTPFKDTLKILDVGGVATIGDKGLHLCTKIKILDASDNKNITTCEPFAANLVVLRAVYSGITDAGLMRCIRIKKLYAGGNCAITTCDPFSKTLRTLYAGGMCGISDFGLTRCHKITTLNILGNSKINTVAHLKFLRRIYYNHVSNITTELVKFKKIAYDAYGYASC